MKHTVVVELFYNGTWNTAPVYTRDPIQLHAGRGDEQADAPPSSCQLTIDNRTGDYNPRNATSTLFGLIGRNTPLRVTVDGAVRFAGEVASWQPQRAVDAGDAWVRVTANGVSRRLGQGASPAPSALQTYIADQDPVAYWPLEDGSLTVQARPLIGAGGPVKITGNTAPAVWGQGRLAPWMPDVVKLHENVGLVMRADVEMAGFVDTWTADCVRSAGFDDVAGASTLFSVVWAVTISDPTFVIVGFDGSSDELTLSLGFSTVATVSIAASTWDDNPHHVRLTATQDGADVDYQVFLDGVSVLTHTDTSETLGRVRQVSTTASINVRTALSVGHWAVYLDPPTLADTVDAMRGHPGEAAGRRIERVCTENGVTFTSTGDLDETAGLGPQYADPVLAIVQEAAAADLGLLTDNVAAVGLHFRTHASLYNQAAALELDFDGGELAPVLEPTIDDQLVRNDVTAKRRDGGEVRDVDQDGPLGVDSIGRYDTSVTVNVAGDGFLDDQASWRLHLGTVDADRWPRVAVDLDAAPALADDVDAIRPGDLIELVNLPDELAAAGVASLLVQGWTETIGSHRRVVTFLCTPADGFEVAVYDTARYDTAGSELAEALDTTETGVDVETLIGPVWTTTDEPFDVIIGGEIMTVSSVGAAIADVQTFTVTRSINGVVKTHAIGEAVRLHPTPRYALG